MFPRFYLTRRTADEDRADHRVKLMVCVFLCLLFASFGEAQEQGGDEPLKGLTQVSDRIYYGAEPTGRKSFQELRDLGIRIVVSVDGAKPDVEGAREFGIRYVHIPFGYDGIPTSSALALVRVMQEAGEEPVFIHCHHGKHRGPAGAAIACRASDPAFTVEQADSLLKRAGTSPDYTGLWRDVAAFVPPDGSIVLPELEEVAQIDSLTEAMASMGRAFDHLKLCELESWTAPSDHPDLVPLNEAVLVWEALRESARLAPADVASEYLLTMKDSEETASALVEAVRNGDTELASTHFQALRTSCKDCHRKFRD